MTTHPGWLVFHDQFVEVGRLGGIQRLEAQVVDEEQLHMGQAAHLGLDAVVQPRGLEALEQLVCAGRVHAGAADDMKIGQQQ